MSQDILKGQWKQVSGKLKEWWGNLTDDDVKRIDGSHERLLGTLQEKYGYAKDRALAEISRRLDEFGKKPSN
ncbi:MAG TPA: CsbD family protein [Polyangiaceae bacterium]|nr:CsbD family protein [Polyangiaceae bacterium]